MLNMKVNVYFKKDILRGHDCTEIRVELKEIIKDRYEEDDWANEYKAYLQNIDVFLTILT